MTRIAGGSTGAQVAWSSAPLRYYRLDVSTNLAPDAWQSLGVVSNFMGALSLERHDPSATNRLRSVYRVECLY
jgi:hypothetical protein